MEPQEYDLVSLEQDREGTSRQIRAAQLGLNVPAIEEGIASAGRALRIG